MSRLAHAPHALACPLAAAFLALLAGSLLGPGAGLAQTAATVPASASTTAAFPLTVRPGKRYLEDAAGRPFLIHGDTAWSLIAQLTREDAETYLEDRRTRGFNTILVNLLEHRFAKNPPANAYGQPPFLAPGDFGAPNEVYFAHADWILRRAADKGFLVLLAPAYLGFRGGNDGWYKEMIANGPARLHGYGQFLGRRYGQFSNILWVHAGDYDPPRKDLVRAIADGIRELDPRALHTAHGAPETAAVEYWSGEPWLQLNNVYTYNPVYAPALEQYARPERLPFFLIESKYEGEEGVSGEQRMRTQAYQAVLSGAAGQVFGNNPIWRFDGPPMHPSPVKWNGALASPGARSMSLLRGLLSRFPWWTLEPDAGNTLLTAGYGAGQDRAVAALSADRSTALVYLPTIRRISIEMGQLAGESVVAHWYDPTDGRELPVKDSPLPASGVHSFKPTINNSAGFGDWVLLLTSRGSRS